MFEVGTKGVCKKNFKEIASILVDETLNTLKELSPDFSNY